MFYPVNSISPHLLFCHFIFELWPLHSFIPSSSSFYSNVVGKCHIIGKISSLVWINFYSFNTTKFKFQDTETGQTFFYCPFTLPNQSTKHPHETSLCVLSFLVQRLKQTWSCWSYPCGTVGTEVSVLIQAPALHDKGIWNVRKGCHC